MATDGSHVGQRVSRYIVSCRRRLPFEVLVVRRIVGQAAGYNKGRNAPSSISGIPPSAHGGEPMYQRDRVRVAVLLASAAMVALGVAFVWLHLASPSDGARLDPNQHTWRAHGVAVTVLRAQPDGLRTGDVVVAVDGKSVESWAQALTNPTTARPYWHAGQVVTYTLDRE